MPILRTLRGWSAGEQIGLLFLIVFGALAIASAISTSMSLKAQTEEQEARVTYVKKLLRDSWAMVSVFWVAWIAGTFVSVLLFGVVSFVALREFITLSHTRRGDHRSLLLAFFVVLPLQYVLVGTRRFDLFSVFIPVYVFFALPVVSALANDPVRFLERNAEIQWGIMVCVYGLQPCACPAAARVSEGTRTAAHSWCSSSSSWCSPAWCSSPMWPGIAATTPVAPMISTSFTWRTFLAGMLAGSLVGTLFYWITPFKAGQAFAVAAIASFRRHVRASS